MSQLRWTSSGGLAAATLAVVASSCCALPMALAFAGVSTGVVGLLGPLHAVRPLILGVAALLLAVGWFAAIRRRAGSAYPLLIAATILLGLALAWQIWDPILERIVMSFGHA